MSCERSPMVDGMEEEKEQLRDSCRRLVRWPITDGMGPVNLLSNKDKYCRLVSSASAVGIVEVIILLSR